MNNDFKNINFGMAAAETEMATQPKLLEEGFFDAYGFIDKIVNKQFFLVYGQKGSGKSAIASKLDLNPPDGTEVILCTLSQLNLNEFEGILSKNKAPTIKDIETWDFLIAIQLINALSKNMNCWRSKSGKVIPKNIISGLESVGLLPSKDLSHVVNIISKKEIHVNFGMIKGRSSRESITGPDIMKLRSNLLNAVYDADVSKKYLLIIDGVDDVLTKREKHMRILSSLLYTCKMMNEKFAKENSKMKIVILYRTDILDRLENPNKTKIINDYGMILDWYKDVRDIKETNLYRLINLRAKISLNRDVDVFTEFFPEEINGKNTANYVLDNTRHTPRDIIMLMNKIQDASKRTISKNSITNGIRDYSNDYFLGEIKDSLAELVNKNDVENVFKSIMIVGKLKTTIKELKETSTAANFDANFDVVLPMLFEVGAIGNIRHINGEELYTFKYRNRHLSFNPLEDIAIHLGLRNALSIG